MMKFDDPPVVQRHAWRILRQVLHERHRLETRTKLIVIIVAHLIIYRLIAPIKIETLNAFHVHHTAIKVSTA